MTLPLDAIDGRIGEAWAGEAPNGSHVNLVVARRGSPTAAAAAGALGATTPGHAPFLACLGAGNLVRPATIVRNKSTLGGADERLSRITWGAAQLGIGQGVLDAVADGLLEAAHVDEILLLAVVWVDPEADDETAVRQANRAAIRAALADALAEDRGEELYALLDGRETARNGYYAGA